ncbi:MAG: hypothetical protein MZV64_17755 [Ignavibacteriales bacterium]|nr:hypothetical protein [Ignavibacteriales bacterium]
MTKACLIPRPPSLPRINSSSFTKKSPNPATPFCPFTSPANSPAPMPRRWRRPRN